MVRGESALLLKKAELDEREKRQNQKNLEIEEQKRALLIEQNKIDQQNKLLPERRNLSLKLMQI